MGGFQFNVSGVNVLSGSGGAAEEAGFQVSTGGATVLGFSFDGSVIPAGSGVLTNLEVETTADEACLSEIVLSDYDGDEITSNAGNCVVFPLANTISLGAATESSLEVLYSSSSDIGGFQFNISGAEVLAASGGAAGDAGFTVSTGGSTVLGFSFTGDVVPAGSGVLTNLDVVVTDSEGCLSDVVVSDANAQELDFEIGDCIELPFSCDDADADGSCDDVDDCVGEFDECGVCNGDGIADGACDCDGNVEDLSLIHI